MKYINRYTVSGILVVLLVSWFCSLSQIIALVLGPLVIGGMWLGWKGLAKPTIKCACCGTPTMFAGYCPCGGRPTTQKAPVCPEKTCGRPGGVVSEEPINDPKGNRGTRRHYTCSGGHSWDAFSSQG